MNKGYRPKGDISPDNLVPPHGGSSIMNEGKSKKKSFGAIIDELLNNPEVMMVQAGRIIEEAKKEAEKVVNKNKELEAVIVEKDKEISYLKGKVDTMEKIIREMNAPIELAVEK